MALRKAAKLLTEMTAGLERIKEVDQTQKFRFHGRQEPDHLSPEERAGTPTPTQIAEELLQKLKGEE